MHPFEQQVRERAYFIWEGEGRVSGHATDHWLRAERELSADRPIQLRPVAAEISLAPSRARALKPRAGVRSAAAKAVETAKPAKAPAAKAAEAPAAKVAKATPSKTASAKSDATKAAAPRSAVAKTTASKATASKSTAPKAAAARSKSFGVETSVVMH